MNEGNATSVDDDPFPDDMEPPELLMEATVRVLAEEGMEGLTLRKVAEKAEKNRGLLHYYFESKDDLLISLLDHILEGTQALVGIDETGSPDEKLSTALRFHAYGPGGVDEAGRHYYQAILQLQALAPHHQHIRERFVRNHRFVVELVTDILEEGIKTGAFRDADVDELATFLVTTIDGARNHDLASGGTAARETALATIDRFLSEQLVYDTSR